MRAPLFVRPPTEEERQALAAGLRSADAFTLRRCQIVLASARGERAPAIARSLGCSEQTVRNAIHAFDARRRGGACRPAPRAPTPSTPPSMPTARERLRALLHRSPREFGHPTSVWTLELAAETAFAEGLTATRVSDETVRATLARHGHPLAAGQDLDHQSRPGVRPKKQRRDRLIALAQTRPDWAVGFADETWWSRLAQPGAAHLDRRRPRCGWCEQTVAKDDPDPKALACYGLLVRQEAAAAPTPRSCGCASWTGDRSAP